MALNDADVARGERVRLIREARGEDQPTLAAFLASKLPDTKYDAALVSKIERGSRRVTFEELEVIANLDPKHRGIAWLGWGGEVTPLRQREPASGTVSLDTQSPARLRGHGSPAALPKGRQRKGRGGSA